MSMGRAEIILHAASAVGIVYMLTAFYGILHPNSLAYALASSIVNY
jgi:hypothetical protein